MRRMLSILALAALVVSALATASPARTRTAPNIVQTAQAAGQFKTLTMLLARAGLASALEQPGPYTVFAPTDAAFAKVPKRTLNALLKNNAKLKAVLLYHVVSGKVTAADAGMVSSAKTLNGKALRLRIAGSNVFVNGVKVTKPDVTASNGVIHVINRVLIP
jgi:uncharacterized surface protein with fasciclin (FAS1) repeats